MLQKIWPFNFFSPNLSKTSHQQGSAYHSKQCHLVAIGGYTLRKDSQNPNLTFIFMAETQTFQPTSHL